MVVGPVGLGTTPADESISMEDLAIQQQIVDALSTDEPLRDMRPLTHEEVKAVVSHEIIDALGSLGSQITEQRRRAIRYYYGRPFGNEQDGRSQVVLTEVRDTVEWIMPDLMDMFTSTGVIWDFEPTDESPEAAIAAREATIMVNHCFMEEQDGYTVLEAWMKTALIEKNGFVKPKYEERIRPKRNVYRGLTEGQVGKIVQNPNVQMTGLTEHSGESPIDIMTGQPIPTYDIEVMETESVGEIVVDGIPPEEFLIARRAIYLNDQTPFAAHRQKTTVSQLIELGYPAELVKNLPSDDTPEFSQGRTERLSEDEVYPMTLADRADPASREIWVTDCYLLIDEDGDGYAEMRNILVVGEHGVTILDDREHNWQPFCSLTPSLMPHRFFGISISDMVMDLQLIRSTLIRQMLDNIYLQNNGRHEVVEGQVEIDDLLTSRPGGIVRVAAPGMINPIITPPLPDMAMGLMEFLTEVRETRTGVSRWQQGPDPSSVKNQTEGGVNAVMASAGKKIGKIAQSFAQTGVKQLGKNLYRLYVENAMGPKSIKVRGQWHTVDPRGWPSKMNVTVRVAKGKNEAKEHLNNLMLVAGMQEKLLQSPVGPMMVTPQALYATLREMCETMGFRYTNPFFTDPGDQPFPEPPPDAEIEVKKMESARRKAEDQAKAQTDTVGLAIEAEKERNLNEYRFSDMHLKAAVDREKIASHERIAEKQIEATMRQALANSTQGGAA